MRQRNNTLISLYVASLKRVKHIYIFIFVWLWKVYKKLCDYLFIFCHNFPLIVSIFSNSIRYLFFFSHKHTEIHRLQKFDKVFLFKPILLKSKNKFSSSVYIFIYYYITRSISNKKRGHLYISSEREVSLCKCYYPIHT